MNGHDVIAIGASAGGLEVLSSLVGGLPADLPASVFVAPHVPPHGFSAEGRRMTDRTAEGPRPRFAVVALAASTGGLQAHTAVLGPLPADFAAAIVLVQHLEAGHKSLLAEIFGRRTAVVVRQAVDGDRIAPGGVWISPPDLHLVLNGDGTLSLTRTDRRKSEALADAEAALAAALAVVKADPAGAPEAIEAQAQSLRRIIGAG